LHEAADPRPRGLGRPAQRRAHHPPRGLAARELEVLNGIAAGATNSQLAAALGVAPSTIATHIEHILAKLHVPNRAAATAHSEGLLSPDPSASGLAR